MDTCSKCNFPIDPNYRRPTTLCPIHESINFFDNLESYISDEYALSSMKKSLKIKRKYSTRSSIFRSALLYLENKCDLYLEGQKEHIRSTAITSDNKYAITYERETIRIWSLELRRQVKIIRDAFISFGPCTLSSDGRYIAYGSSDEGSLHFLDIISEQTEWIITGHTDRIKDIVFTVGNNYIVTGSADTSVRIWNLASARQYAVLNGHTSCVKSVAVTRDNAFIISGSTDKTIRVWSFSEKIQCFIFHANGPVTRVVGSRGNVFVVYVSDFRNVWMWKIGENAVLVNSTGVTFFAITNDSNYIIMASRNGQLNFWNVQQKREERSFSSVNKSSVQRIAISDDDQYLLCEHSDHSLVLWRIGDQSEEFAFDGHTDDVISISITRDCKYVVSGSNDGTVRVWSTEDKRQKSIIKIHDTDILNVAVTDRFIVVGLINGLALVWRLLQN